MVTNFIHEIIFDTPEVTRFNSEIIFVTTPRLVVQEPKWGFDTFLGLMLPVKKPAGA